MGVLLSPHQRSEWVSIRVEFNVAAWRRLRSVSDFYRAKLRVARYCQGKLSLCPSVHLSVTLRYRDHIGWNSAKIISRLISLTISFSADPNIMDLLQREHLQSLAGRGVG